MTVELVTALGVAAFAGSIVVLFAVALKRGKAMQATNVRIEENQRRIIANTEKQILLAERSAAALERIAAAQERRG